MSMNYCCWNELNCDDSDVRVTTEGMNVSGGCLVRTIVWGDTSSFKNPTSVSQTFLSNMHVEEVRENGKFQYVLTPGKEIP